MKLTGKLERIKGTGVLGTDLSWLNNNFQRSLTRYAKQCDANRLRELEPGHRYATMTCFLLQFYHDTVDHLMDMFDKLINKIYTRAQKDVDTHQKSQPKNIRQSLETFSKLTDLITESLQKTYSPKFNDFALEFYSLVADNYAPFYSLPIECTDRDAPYVLDGLLYNESDLPLEEHYTDTHGYTEKNFAAFAMLGRTFSPRIHGLKKQRIYKIDADRDCQALKPLVSHKDRIIHMDWIVEQWDRLGHFYASLECGLVRLPWP